MTIPSLDPEVPIMSSSSSPYPYPEPMPDPGPASTAERRLRTVLRLNAGFSLATGLAGLVAGGPVADLLGVDQVWLVRLVGGGLVGFAAAVVAVASAGRPVLHRWSGAISAADFGWVVATVAVLTAGWLSTAGAVVMALIGLLVLDLGVGQLMARRRMGDGPVPGDGPIAAGGQAAAAGRSAPKNPAR